MGLLTFAGRVVLVVVNIIFVLVSLLLMLFGFLLRFADDMFKEYGKDALKSIEDNVKSVYGQADFKTENFELGQMVNSIAVCCIVLGFVFLCLSFLGCCGACCNITTIMLIYAIVLIVIAATQVLVVVLAFGTPDVLKDPAKENMAKTLDEYQGLNGTTAVSLSWNWMMRQYDCCGAKDYKDFEEHATQWWGKGQLTTPDACCKSLPISQTDRDNCAGTVTGTRKTVDEIAANSNYNKGCVDEFWEDIFVDNQTPFLTVFGFLLIGQIILIIFAILVYQDRGITGLLI